MARIPLFFIKPGSRSPDDLAREMAERVIEIMNQERARQGLPPMEGDAKAPPAPRYPRPDRSDLRTRQYVRDGVAGQGDVAARDYLLVGGRPCRVEAWWHEGVRLVTLFFSSQDLLVAKPEELLRLVSPVLDAEGVPEPMRQLTAHEVHVIQDASDNPMFSLTFTVGLPD